MLPKMSSTELVKQIAFGALFGLASGLISRTLAKGFISGALTASFLIIRWAIFDGHHLAKWSPLVIDDPSWPCFLKRKARRETQNMTERAQVFFRENLLIVSGFAGGLIITSL